MLVFACFVKMDVSAKITVLLHMLQPACHEIWFSPRFTLARTFSFSRREGHARKRKR